MSRVIPDSEPEVFFAAPAKRPSPENRKETTYSERLVKYIPAEVLAGYIFVGSQTAHFETHSSKVIFLLTLIGLCVVAIPIHYRQILPRTKKARKHMLISQVAFLVWAYAIGGPVAVVGWHHPGIGGLVMVAFTFLIPLFKP